MLATLTKAPPTGERWLHEIKFDGYRLQAHIEHGKVALWTRGGLDWTKKFGEAVPEALRDLPIRAALIDGEMVVESEGGVAQFSLLQADLSDGRLDRFAYYAFDCPYLDGYDLREAPLIQRKELLSQLIGTNSGRHSLQLALHGGRQARAATRLRACGSRAPSLDS
jgi:bifunctional non-homologous end joining protein LigD